MAQQRAAYAGNRQTLVIGIDVGTTFSGVTYAILRPNELPQVQSVTRFPGQSHASGDSKVPSVMYYDVEGVVRAVGAETEDDNIQDQATEEGWSKVEHFKLRLRPESMPMNTNGLKLGTLPESKNAVQVFGDFLKYMFDCTIKYIKDTHADGIRLWDSTKDHVEFVLSHPNGWEGAQQQLMRRSAVLGGLIPDTDEGRSRIKFISEGEASLHACLSSRLAPADLKPGDAFIVADAGGGTLDINTYRVMGLDPLRLEEIVPSDCRFAGSVFVNMFARAMLETKLQGSQYGRPELLDIAAFKTFDRTTKRLFSDSTQTSWLQIGNIYERNAALGVKGGKLKLTGLDMADCFEFSVRQMVESITVQKEGSEMDRLDVWLVGGFAGSNYLFSQLQARLANIGITVCRPDTNTSKAVANGAISFYLDHFVTARVSRFATGVDYYDFYNANNPEHAAHIQRGSHVAPTPSGRSMIGPKFQCFITKGLKVTETATVCHGWDDEIMSLDDARVDLKVLVYRGALDNPSWMDEDKGNFKPLCTVTADLRHLCGAPLPAGPFGIPFWRLSYQIEFKFGLTEYEARIKWTENGQTKYGPAAIIYDV